MLCLARYLGLIIGDLVPEDNENWQLYLKLRQIIDIVTAPSATRYDAIKLKQVVSEHNALYFRLIGPLKPKMHFMTHYPRLLLLNGPLSNSWGMPFERKNKELKEVADATKSNRNLPLTVATNLQLNACYVKEFCQGIDTDYQKGPTVTGIVNSGISQIFAHVENKKCIQQISSVHMLGKNFSEETVFLADIDEDEEPYFGEVKGVYEVSGQIHILTSMLETLYFYDHRHAYKMSGEILETRTIHIDDVPRIDPVMKLNCGNDTYLACKYGV
ncbi:hypothetical protein QAD02_021880 [Eretmocerus hayati]|uniref:Uncharacterized protein n=1 Tax=Eretmocerus hayati TaxID=131215 RepID=A0ACC2PT12_9HYME|nr:hypothetical protein QAD02_021880 [Eretmocerus hayati]